MCVFSMHISMYMYKQDIYKHTCMLCFEALIFGRVSPRPEYMYICLYVHMLIRMHTNVCV